MPVHFQVWRLVVLIRIWGARRHDGPSPCFDTREVLLLRVRDRIFGDVEMEKLGVLTESS